MEQMTMDFEAPQRSKRVVITITLVIIAAAVIYFLTTKKTENEK